MAILTATTPSINSSSTVTFNSASSGGDSFVNDGKTSLYLKNSGSSSTVVTIVSASTVGGGLSVGDVSITLAASEERVTSSFLTRYFNDSNGRVDISYSDATDITVAVLKTNSF